MAPYQIVETIFGAARFPRDAPIVPDGTFLVLARPVRFELTTPGSVDQCSIQLSYGRSCRQRSLAVTEGRANYRFRRHLVKGKKTDVGRKEIAREIHANYANVAWRTCDADLAASQGTHGRLHPPPHVMEMTLFQQVACMLLIRSSFRPEPLHWLTPLPFLLVRTVP